MRPESAPLLPEDPPRGWLARFVQKAFFLTVVRPLMALFIGLRVRKRRRLPDPIAGPCVIVANHQSHFDTVSLLALYPLNRLKYVRPAAAADYWAANQFIEAFARTCINILPIERVKAGRKHDPIEVMVAALDRGQSLILFPEGTRSADGTPGRFKPGVAMILEKRPGTPVVPVWLQNLGRILPKGEFVPVPVFCEIRVGRPFTPTGTRDEILAEVEAAVHQLGGSTPISPS